MLGKFREGCAPSLEKQMRSGALRSQKVGKSLGKGMSQAGGIDNGLGRRRQQISWNNANNNEKSMRNASAVQRASSFLHWCDEIGVDVLKLSNQSSEINCKTSTNNQRPGPALLRMDRLICY